MDSVKKVPEIRIKGFYEEWEKEFLKDNVEFYSGLTYKPSDVCKKSSSSVLVIRSSNIKNGKFVLNNDDVYVKEEALNSTKTKMNDIAVVVRNGSRPLIGKHGIVTKYLKKATVGAFMTGIRTYRFDFINILLDTNTFRKQVDENIGATINQITNSTLNSMYFYFPNSNEQTQIGNFFKNLDKKLELEKEKHEKLINFKKAMLENMFPREGKKVPKVRFEGFDDEWNISKLGDLGEISSSGVDKKLYPDEKTVYLLNYMDVYNKKQPSKENINEFMITSANEHELVSKSVKKGDVFFTPTSETSDDIGHSMAIYNTVENLVYSYHILRFRPFDNGLDVSFSNYFANINPVRKQLITNCQGAQRMTLKLEEFKNLIVSLPSLEEQALIGNFFKNLDEKIEISEKKIEKIENFKKAMLDKMFV